MTIGRPSARDQVLTGFPGTRAEIAKKSGASSATVGKWLAILRAEGVVHIARWRRSKRGSKRPVFVVGVGVDAKEPKTLTPQQSQERYRNRHPERRAEIRERYDDRQRKKKERIKTLMAPLFNLPKQLY